jgi:hypothetical protein
MLQTEFEFTLPKGYVDKDGNLHTTGIMRLANARDEIAPLQDPRVMRNEAYLAVIVLSRVILKLGELSEVTPATVEGLFSADFAYLQDLYGRINSNGHARVTLECPECEASFQVSEDALQGGGPASGG